MRGRWYNKFREVDDFIQTGYNLREAQLNASKEIKRNYAIDFWDV